MARFVPNRNLTRQLERTTNYLAVLLDAAKEAEDAAKRIARSEAYEEGDYHDSIEGTRVGLDVVLQAKDFKAGWIEYGQANFKTVAPLRRGAKAVGLVLKGSSK
jgi:hypothetical protein